MLTTDKKIARARVAGLIRAVASALNRAAVLRAKGKGTDAAAADREAQALRVELEAVEAAAEERLTPAAPAAPEAVEEDAGAAAEQAIERRRLRTRRPAYVAELRRSLAEDGPIVPLLVMEGVPGVPPLWALPEGPLRSSGEGRA